MCCNQASGSPLVESIYSTIGNPFAFPANLLFSIRYDVPLRRWDRIAGSYIDFPDLHEYNEERHRRHTYRWNLMSLYLLEGWGQEQTIRGDVYRWTTAQEASLLIPLYDVTEARTFTLWVHPNGTQQVQIALNGSVRISQSLHKGWNELVLRASPSQLERGMNEISVHSVPAAFRADSRLVEGPPSTDEVGVAIRGIDIRYGSVHKPSAAIK